MAGELAFVKVAMMVSRASADGHNRCIVGTFDGTRAATTHAARLLMLSSLLWVMHPYTQKP